MKFTRSIIVIITLVAVLLGVTVTRQVAAATIPTIDIVSVVEDQSVTVQTHNFPANMKFDVRMGAFGTLGVNGTLVTTIDSGTGGEFKQTFTIPSALQGSAKIAIRLESSSGYFAYDWFTNNTAAAATSAAASAPTATKTPGPTSTAAPTNAATATAHAAKIPTTTILGVVQGKSVTLQTSNFPKNLNFNVRMGKFGTLGVNGTIVSTINSGNGGSFVVTFPIPADLANSDLIAIRLESTVGGYFAYDWFQNTTYGTSGTPVPSVTPAKTGTASAATATPAAKTSTPTPAATAKPGTATATPKPSGSTTSTPAAAHVPTINITSVDAGKSVSLTTLYFPKNVTFTVRMGKMWTAGVNGIVVTTVNSGDSGIITATFDIPAELKDEDRISIRLESSNGYYFSYDWFWNQ